jgi:hypothetical protein
LSWELLYPQRRLLGLTVLALAAACACCSLLPEEARTANVAGLLVVACLGLLVPVVGLLSHGAQGRLESTASGFPPRLFTLPVRTAALVAPPIVLATTVVLVAWLACAACLLRPCQIDIPLLWPALFAAAALALIQALVWSPMPFPFVRPFAVIFVIPCLAFVAATALRLGLGDAFLLPLAAALLLAGVVCSWHGVRRARRGVGLVEPLTVGPVPTPLAAAPAPPFSSPLRAQLWLERRFTAWLFPIMAGTFLGGVLFLMAVFDVFLGQHLPLVPPWLGQAESVVGRSWLVMGCLLLLPLWASLTGGDLGGMAELHRGYAMPAFFATRPFSTGDMVRAKLIVSAAFVCRLWAVVTLAGLGWAVVMGRVGEMAGRLVALAGSPFAATGLLAGGLALLAVVTWLWTIANFWAGASGRPFAAVVAPLTAVVAALTLVVLLVSLPDRSLPVLGGVVSLALAAKAAAVVWAARRVRLEHLASRVTLAWAVAGWALLAAVLVALALRLTGGRLLVAGCVVLLLPLARCLLAPLALARNRTR